MPVYEELLDFVTSAPSLEEILNFAHSKVTLERVNYLLDARDNGTLSTEEERELEEFLSAVEVMEQLKIRARKRLGLPEE